MFKACDGKEIYRPKQVQKMPFNKLQPIIVLKLVYMYWLVTESRADRFHSSIARHHPPPPKHVTEAGVGQECSTFAICVGALHPVFAACFPVGSTVNSSLLELS